MSKVPPLRCTLVNTSSIRSEARYVVYWMMAARRPFYNFALERAAEHAQALGLPLIIFEDLRCGYELSSVRMHTFMLEGMRDNLKFFQHTPAFYFPAVETTPGQNHKALIELCREAAVVIIDEFPSFILPKIRERAFKDLQGVALEVVDTNGLLPLRAATQTFPTAYVFRRFLQKNLLPHLYEMPSQNPLAGKSLARLTHLSPKITALQKPLPENALLHLPDLISTIPLKENVPPSLSLRGGHRAGENTLKDFVKNKLSFYADQRSDPDANMQSGLSPYLHFGHLSVHEVFKTVCDQEKWNPDLVSLKSHGKRSGWWNMGRNAESFLDELITWRELGYNFSHLRPRDHKQYSSLPDWAQRTLAEANDDQREHLYTLKQFETGQTHDELWNAAQNELVQTGRIHNYLRMLWGKKILEWSESPQKAAEIMIYLNDKYALDGGNPNSYSGIFWVLGRYDRPWAPKRKIFGSVRWMSSANTVKKLKCKKYLDRWARKTFPKK